MSSALAALMIFGVLTFTPVNLDFADTASLEQIHALGRQGHSTEHGCMVLRGGGSLYTREKAGPGVYHVQFRMVEVERFQYHVPRFDLLKADPEDPKSNGYSLSWQPHGILRFTALVDGEVVHSRVFINPGRDNPNRYASGDSVDLVVRVPPAGDCIEVFCHAQVPGDEPSVRFKLTDLPLEGHFGWHNDKWFSDTWIHHLGYTPAP